MSQTYDYADKVSQPNGEHSHLDSSESHDDALKKVRTAGSISLTPELFEKLYLSPQNNVAGDLRKTFGNPTPIGLGGFLLSLSPLSADLMGWSAGIQAGNGASHIPNYLFFGGILMNVAGVMEWILGNTYIAVVFMTFGCFWLSFGGTLQPFYAAWALYSPNPNNPELGLTTAGFDNSFAYFPLWMAVLCTVYLICSLRTNIVLVGILAPLPPAFGCISAAFFHLAQGNAAFASTLLTAGGALTFVTVMCGWYLFAALMLAGIDFPLQLPVCDLSTRIKGASHRSGPSDAASVEGVQREATA